VKPVRGSVLSQRSERPGDRLEHPELAAARRRRFGLAAAIGIPLGFILGRFTFLNAMASPVISLLRPVSPLAWLPIGLLVFKAANPAAIWVIFISSIWPMIINTAVGVQRVPQDYLNVARVLNLSEWKVVTRILFPATLPYVLTGIRLSIGVAWLVIVAAEMLTGAWASASGCGTNGTT
jgi:nitrate/nitrite transport system permease protein